MSKLNCQGKDRHSLTNATSFKQELSLINWKTTKLWNETSELH